MNRHRLITPHMNTKLEVSDHSWSYSQSQKHEGLSDMADVASWDYVAGYHDLSLPGISINSDIVKYDQFDWITGIATSEMSETCDVLHFKVNMIREYFSQLPHCALVKSVTVDFGYVIVTYDSLLNDGREEREILSWVDVGISVTRMGSVKTFQEWLNSVL